MKKKFLPLFTTPGVVMEKKTIFYKINEKVEIKVPGTLMAKLINLADGNRSIREIILDLDGEWDENSVQGLFVELISLQLVIHSHEVTTLGWKAVENPPYYFSPLSDDEAEELVKESRERHLSNGGVTSLYSVTNGALQKLLENRKSIRNFSDTPIALQALVNILWASYGESCNGHRTIPSAGSLYPLVVHIALLQKVGDVVPGIYKVYFGSQQHIGFNLISADVESLSRAFLDPLQVDRAQGIILISGSFSAVSQKYGNRSILFAALEAGHVAQNVHLAAIENGIATVEIGGFIEELVMDSLKLPTEYHPLTTIILGHESLHKPPCLKSKIEVEWAVPIAQNYKLPFAMAYARATTMSGEDDWSCGRAVSPQLAHIKAVAEAREWAALEAVPPVLVEARFSDLPTAIDPRKVIRFHPAQYRLKGFPLKPFNSVYNYEWARGKNELTGATVHVVADCVYLGYSPKSPRYSRANSSGTAAHPIREKAVMSGTLELVERDAFMIAYMGKLSLPTIDVLSLPVEIHSRVTELQKIGFNVWIKDFSLDLAPVIFIFAQSDELSFTMCSSSCNFNIEEALDHALMEIESAVLIRLANGAQKNIAPAHVRTPEDHGALYAQKRYFQRANFLVRGNKKISFSKVGNGTSQSWNELLNCFDGKKMDLVTIPLYLDEEVGGDNNLHIIRSIVPGIVPISFGYQLDPRGTERLYEVVKNFTGRTPVYKDISKFPHPFT